MPMPDAIKNLLSPQTLTSVGKTVAPVAAGYVAAQLGGALLKQIDAVGAFAVGGEYQEAAVDLAGGALATVATAAVMGAAHVNADTITKTAALMGVGAVLSAAAPVIAKPMADAIDKVVGFIAGDEKAAATALPAPSPAKQLPARTAPTARTITMAKAGGLYDLHPGGLYDRSAM